MPIFVVELRMIRPVIVSGTPRFRTEHRLLLEVFVLRLTELRLFRAQVFHVLNCRLAGDAAFREGSRRELVGGATDGVAGAEEALDGHHPIVSPLVFRWCAVLRTACPRA